MKNFNSTLLLVPLLLIILISISCKESTESYPEDKKERENEHLTIDTISTRNLNDIMFLNDNKGYIVGDQGLFLIYEDGIWNEIETDFSDNIRSISVLNSSSGIMVGDNGLVAKFNDKNITSIDYIVEQNLNDIQVVDSSISWVVGDESKILYLENDNWFEYTVKLFEYISPDYHEVHFINQKYGVIVGDYGVILEFIGDTFYLDTTYKDDLHDNTSVFVFDTNSYAFSVATNSPESGGAIIVKENHFLDYHWVLDYQTINSIHLFNQENGIMVSSVGEIYRLENNVLTLDYQLENSLSLNSLSMKNDTTCLIVGRDGLLLEYKLE